MKQRLSKRALSQGRRSRHHYDQYHNTVYEIRPIPAMSLTELCAKLILVVTVAMSLSIWRIQIQANPIPDADLPLSLWPQSPDQQQQPQAQQVLEHTSKMMERILNDQYDDDFPLSINLLTRMAWSLEENVRSRQLEDGVAKGDAMSKWAASMGINDQSSQTIAKELDLVLATFWSKFKSTVEEIIKQRPLEFNHRVLDFRCSMRRAELTDLMALSAQSSLYSIFMDTFLSELYTHCLVRKLAQLRMNNFEPTPLLKQYVATYLELPLMDLSKTDSRATFNQMLAGRASNFDPAAALGRVGSLGSAARLVADPRSFLAPTLDAEQSAEMARQFGDNCRLYNEQLASVWGDFDDFTRIISTGASNLADTNQRVKLTIPRLIYAAICGQLVQLPLWV